MDSRLKMFLDCLVRKKLKKKKNRNSVMEKWKFVETTGNLVSFVISVQSVKKKQKNKKRKAIDNMKVI